MDKIDLEAANHRTVELKDARVHELEKQLATATAQVERMREAASRLAAVIYSGTNYEDGEPSLYTGSITLLHESMEALASLPNTDAQAFVNKIKAELLQSIFDEDFGTFWHGNEISEFRKMFKWAADGQRIQINEDS